MKKLTILFFALVGCFLSLQAERDTLRVFFDEGAEQVTGFQQSLIDIFVRTHYAAGEVIVAGHTDDQGDARANLMHSRTRAQVVTEYLLGKGLGAQQLVMEAWGETRPLYPNSNPINRARNRRVELIGIPNPDVFEDVRPLARQQLTLRNGEQVAYREMTTPEGGSKKIYVITIDKPAEPAQSLLNFGLNSLLGGSPVGPPLPDACANALMMRFTIPVSKELRCPISQIKFDDVPYNGRKTGLDAEARFLKPVLSDSGYHFEILIPDRRACAAPTYAIGDKCHTEQQARVKLDHVRSRDFVGRIQVTGERFIPQLSTDGSYAVHYVNGDPNTLKIQAVLYKSRMRMVTLSKLPLGKLPYDAGQRCYVISPKDLRALRKVQDK